MNYWPLPQSFVIYQAANRLVSNYVLAILGKLLRLSKRWLKAVSCLISSRLMALKAVPAQRQLNLVIILVRRFVMRWSLLIIVFAGQGFVIGSRLRLRPRSSALMILSGIAPLVRIGAIWHVPSCLRLVYSGARLCV